MGSACSSNFAAFPRGAGSCLKTVAPRGRRSPQASCPSAFQVWPRLPSEPGVKLEGSRSGEWNRPSRLLPLPPSRSWCAHRPHDVQDGLDILQGRGLGDELADLLELPYMPVTLELGDRNPIFELVNGLQIRFIVRRKRTQGK